MRARILYGIGSFGASLLQQTVLLWVFYYYAPPPGQGLPMRISASLLGLALGAGRVVDALADPPIAYLSDRLRLPGGRRRPFIIIGAPLLAITFAALWMPPSGLSPIGNFLYLGTALGAFYFLFTVVMNPYTALLPEITPGGAGRVEMAAWQAGFSLVGTAAAFIGSSALISRVGFPAMGLILAPLGLAALWTPAASVHERAVPEAPVAFGSAARAVLRSRPFRIFLVGLTLLWFGLSMVNLSLALVVTILMGLPRGSVGPVLAGSIAVTLLSFPVIAQTTHRVGKRRALLAVMTLAAVIVPFIGLIGVLPVGLPAPWQGYLLIALAGPPIAGLFVLPNAILADIAEDHGLTTGHRSEGMFFALQGLVFNGTTSLAAVVLGLLLDQLGYAPGDAFGLRIVPFLAAAAVILGAVVFTRFPERKAWQPG